MDERPLPADDEPVRSRSGEPETFTIEGGRSPAEPGPATPVSHKRRNLIIAAAAVVVAAGVAIGVALAGGTPSVTVHGSINLGGYLASQDTTNPDASIGSSTPIQAGDACVAATGYTDIAEGTTVTVGGSNGQSIGVGALSDGKETAGGYCQFTFSVSVPGGQSAYTVTISHRGTQTFTPAQVKSGIVLTLGE